jgi:hypothetical protein
MAENVLYYGDNLEILRRYIKNESVVLVYLAKTSPRIRLSRAVAKIVPQSRKLPQLFPCLPSREACQVIR